MIRVGLTGSIASGKSEVARIFRAAGIPVFDADQAVHDLYADGTAAKALPDLFQSAIRDHMVDRSRLSALLLKDKPLFAQLEAVIHPLVRMREEAFFAAAEGKGEAMALADIPLLFEKNRGGDFAKVIVVSAPESLRRERALKRPGMTPEKLDAMMARQMPDKEKRDRATYVIENDSNFETLARRTHNVIRQLGNNTP